VSKIAAVLLGLALAALALATPSWQEDAALRDSLSRVHPRFRASWLRERGIRDEYWQGCVRPVDSGLRCVGRWSFGPSYDVDGRVTPTETLVALARGSGVSLIRFARTDSTELEPLADINAGGLMKRVAVRDSLLYVGSTAGLEIWSIADERNPRQLSWLHTALNDFCLQDSFAYIIGPDDSFKVYNISSPTNPVFRGACRDSGDLVSVAGNAAFIGDRWGLYVIDVSNPANPHRIGSWGSAIEQVLARGRLCYVTTFNPNQPGEIAFHVLDVTTPSSPTQIGVLNQTGGEDVHLVDTLAFCSGESDFNQFTIVSVADSTQPRLIGTVGRPGWGMGIWASGLDREAFAASHWEGLQVYDVRNAAQPVRDTFLLGADAAVDVWLDNGRVYVANEMAGLKILDVTDPTRPTTLGSCDTGGQRPAMSAVVARDSFAFVDWFPLRVLDVADPSHPRVAAQLELFAPPEDMVIRDSLVYCAEMNRFQVVNVARPRQPVLVGSCVSTDGNYFGLAVQDTLAYEASLYGMWIINVARPASPFVASSNVGRNAAGIAVRDTFVYLPAAYDTLWVYSVANPASPRVLGFAPLLTHSADVALADTLAVVATANGLEIFSLADPAHPRRLGFCSTPDGPRRVVYAWPHFYTAMWEAGVGIYAVESTGIGEELLAPGVGRAGVIVTPNPARGWCVVTADNLTGSKVVVRDVAGRTVVVQRAKPDAERRRLTVNLPGLEAGVYFLLVSSGRRVTSAKLVVQ